jgi:putative ABC transport system permease protein
MLALIWGAVRTRRAQVLTVLILSVLAATLAAAINPQVWLNDKAPADIVDRLSAAGLTVLDDDRSTVVRRQLDEQAPALALWFYALAGGLAVLLGAGALVLAAAVDRGRRVEDLTALRAQGLRRPTAARATLWTYPVLVALAVVAGLAITLLAWRITGSSLPLAGLNPSPFPLPGWPRPAAVLGAGAGVFVLLTAVAVLSGRRTLRAIP